MGAKSKTKGRKVKKSVRLPQFPPPRPITVGKTIGPIAYRERGSHQSIEPNPVKEKIRRHLDYRIVLNNVWESVAPAQRQHGTARHEYNWWIRHRDCFENLHVEQPVASLIRALGLYETRCFEENGRLVADDQVLGPCWLEIWRNVRHMLNGDIGGLDGGLTDKALFALARSAGFDEEDLA